jgi:ubiquinone/menaquinone biosynthesis C-methylase UbiE
VAGWYDELLEASPDSYQRQVILPNLLRLLAIKKNDHILDLACGQGFFARAMADGGARVVGVDAALELIALAKKHSPKSISYYISSADHLDMLDPASFTAVVIILAIQNIKDMSGVFAACNRVLAPNGRFIMVINHPAFRIPKHSSWGWEEESGVQYRRVDAYLTESSTEIEMHPGLKSEDITLSFHRPMQSYVNMLAKQGFAVTRMEEWISHRESMKGPRQTSENKIRKEIPLFMMLESRKL